MYVDNINLILKFKKKLKCLHTKFLKADTQTAEPHTKSAKPYTNFHITLFAKHNTILYVTLKNLTGINIMAKVFANVCFWDAFVIFWMQCFILQEMWGIWHFVCAILGFVCKVLKKRGKVLKMCVSSLKKNCRPINYLCRWFTCTVCKSL